MSQTEYLIFTWDKCSRCKDLKGALGHLITSGRIKEYDLDRIASNAQLMRLFRTISPSNNVPALAIVRNGALIGKGVGADQIISMFNGN